MSEDTDDPVEVDAARRRRMGTIVGRVAAVGALLAVLSGVAGAEGRASLAVLLLVTAVGSALAALYGLVSSVLDEYRGAPVTSRRIVMMVGLFLATVGLMAMVAGVGG